MPTNIVFMIQSIISFAIYGLVSLWYVAPYLARQAMTLLLLPHIVHYARLVVIVLGIVSPQAPRSLEWIVFVGDPGVLVVALLAMWALRLDKLRLAYFLLWILTAGFVNSSSKRLLFC